MAFRHSTKLELFALGHIGVVLFMCNNIAVSEQTTPIYQNLSPCFEQLNLVYVASQIFSSPSYLILIMLEVKESVLNSLFPEVTLKATATCYQSVNTIIFILKTSFSKNV